jgi:sec-independent protein translocase protein TatC
MINLHLNEIKWRIFYLIIGILNTFLVGYAYSYEVLFLFTKPLIEITNKPNTSFIFTELTEAFFIQIEGSFILAIVFAFCPLILIHLWLYLKPSLFEYEAKALTQILILFLLSIILGFIIGYSKIIPTAWQFFINFELNLETLPYSILLEAKIKEYIDLLFRFTCMIVLAFQIPCFVGVALITSFVKIESIITKRRYLFFAVWLVAALITPPDIVSQIFMAVPLYFFIEVGFLIYFLIKK